MTERKKAMEKLYQIKHKQELAAKRRIYCQANKDRIYAYQCEWRAANADACKEKAKEYYFQHKESMDARARARALPLQLHRAMLKEFKSKHCPWNEGHVAGVYQVDFD